MKRTDATNLANKILDMHKNDLQAEMNDLVERLRESDDGTKETLIATILANAMSVSIKHSVTATFDVLANIGLLDIEEDC